MSRPCGLTCTVGDELLHDPVFQRVERDNDQPPAGLECALGCKECTGEFAQFVIDEDAQALERARRRMDLVFRIIAESTLDRIGKVAGALEGCLLYTSPSPRD